MKNYLITYTCNYLSSTETLTVVAPSYTSAYVAAMIALPADAYILEAKEMAGSCVA